MPSIGQSLQDLLLLQSHKTTVTCVLRGDFNVQIFTLFPSFQAMSTHRGWMASLWRRADTPTASAKVTYLQIATGNHCSKVEPATNLLFFFPLQPTLASLFVQFLETESAPATPLSSSPAPAQETTPTVEQQSPLEQPKPKPVS